ncbi:DNA-processing protein DprA [Streptomyces sp. NPDC057199]|uniref:DNA-processing protein DprA n=1 Tax=Streptomyces sp. NPDC057199 TaxID=3346047 RepID=UPI003624CB65
MADHAPQHLGRRHRAQPHQALTAPPIQHSSIAAPACPQPAALSRRFAVPRPVLPERAARAALAAHFTPAQLASELAQFSAQEVWEQRVRHDSSGRLAQYRPTEELDNAQLSCRFVIPSDEVWPTALADLGPSCPLGLWARGGDRLPQLTASAVAVTGNRNATEQATTRAQAFATALAEAGHTVTATLAYGVDSAAHRAAALAGRATLAVLPRGLDRAHPHDHAQLLSSIPATGGAVVSLYRPGTETSGATLKASAVLVAALARAVIVIEALDHSEAMHTAGAAFALRRLLLAPPPTEDVRADGSARLLAEQHAVLVPDLQRALALL